MVGEQGWCVEYKGAQICNNDVETEGICVEYKGAKVCHNEAEEVEEQGLKKFVKKVGKVIRNSDIQVGVSNQEVQNEEWTVSGCVTIKGVKVCKQELDALLAAEDFSQEGFCVGYKSGLEVCNRYAQMESQAVCVTYKGVQVCHNEEEIQTEGVNICASYNGVQVCYTK